MPSKKGSAVIYVVIAVLVLGTIMSYIYASTTNAQINQLMQIQEIEQIYEKDVSTSSAISQIYQGFIDQIPSASVSE